MIESLLLWGIVLVCVSLVLLAAEAFIPSGGLISLVAAAVAISGVVCLFKFDWKWGLVGGGTVAVMGPLVFMFALQLMPSTRMGRTLMFGEAGEERPVGTVRLGGQRVDALAEFSYIRAGSTVRVVSVDGTTIKVRAV